MFGQEILGAGQYLTSQNRLYQLSMQSDGNLALYYTWPGGRTGSLWSSRTNGVSGAYAKMQTDGNLVVYDSSNAARWASNTAGNSGAYLTLGNDGNATLAGTAWNTQGQVYNRQAAVNYANAYATKRNPNFPSVGNDCTNFVSQVISAGGYPQKGGSSSTDDTQWWLHKGCWASRCRTRGPWCWTILSFSRTSGLVARWAVFHRVARSTPICQVR